MSGLRPLHGKGDVLPVACQEILSKRRLLLLLMFYRGGWNGGLWRISDATTSSQNWAEALREQFSKLMIVTWTAWSPSRFLPQASPTEHTRSERRRCSSARGARQ